jgi:hypothetical protein
VSLKRARAVFRNLRRPDLPEHPGAYESTYSLLERLEGEASSCADQKSQLRASSGLWFKALGAAQSAALGGGLTGEGESGVDSEGGGLSVTDSRSLFLGLIAATLLASCSSKICASSASTVTFDAGVDGGCAWSADFKVCQEPSNACTNECTPFEYALICSQFVAADSSLDCRVIPIPTPAGVTVYCCPCSG